MRIFVSGGTGVIGWRAVRALVAAGHDVTALARSEPKADQVRALGATPVGVSLFEPAALPSAMAGSEAVVNLATHIPPTTSALRSKAWRENDTIRTEGVRNLVAAAREVGATRFVQESIAFNYRDQGAEWLDEDSPLVDSPYTAATTAAEREATGFTGEGRAGVVLRFGNFYAPDAAHISDLVKYARRGWSMFPGAPDAYWPLIELDDAADAVVAALHVPAGTYNVVDDTPLTRQELADVLAAGLGRRNVRVAPRLLTRIMARRAPNMVGSQRVSNRRFVEAAGWHPAHPSLREGLPGVLEHLGQGPRIGASV